VPAVVRVVEEIKNAVGSCDWASPPVVDLRLGITADGSYVVVIREVVQYVFLNSERGAELVLSGPASKDLASPPPCRRRRIVSRFRSRVSNKTLIARAALAKPWRQK
jgi:hypothetical protein